MAKQDGEDRLDPNAVDQILKVQDVPARDPSIPDGENRLDPAGIVQELVEVNHPHKIEDYLTDGEDRLATEATVQVLVNDPAPNVEVGEEVKEIVKEETQDAKQPAETKALKGAPENKSKK